MVELVSTSRKELMSLITYMILLTSTDNGFEDDLATTTEREME